MFLSSSNSSLACSTVIDFVSMMYKVTRGLVKSHMSIRALQKLSVGRNSYFFDAGHSHYLGHVEDTARLTCTFIGKVTKVLWARPEVKSWYGGAPMAKPSSGQTSYLS